MASKIKVAPPAIAHLWPSNLLREGSGDEMLILPRSCAKAKKEEKKRSQKETQSIPLAATVSDPPVMSEEAVSEAELPTPLPPPAVVPPPGRMMPPIPIDDHFEAWRYLMRPHTYYIFTYAPLSTVQGKLILICSP